MTRQSVIVICSVAVVGSALATLRVVEGAPAVAQGAVAQGNASRGAGALAQAGCENCHGPQGRGTASAPDLATSTLSAKDFIAYVRKPTGRMPALGTRAVSDAALMDIHAFLRQPRPQATPVVERGVPAGRVEAGARLYGSIGCYQCHSNEGQGGVQGPRIGPDPVPFARFSSYIRNPTGDMPPYTAVVLSNQDLADIYAFLAARPRPPAVNSIPLLAD